MRTDEREWGPPWAHGRKRRHRRPPPFVRWLLAAVIAWIQVAGTTFAAEHQSGREALDPLAYLLLIAGPVALLLRRRHPVPVLGVAFGTTLTYWLLGYPEGPIFIALAIAFFTAVAKGERRAAAAVAIAGYFGFLWGPYLLGDRDTPDPGAILGLAAWIIAIAAGAEMARTRRQQMIESRQRRAEEGRRQASEERERIARELHDVLAHNISLINVQAGVALHLMDKDPEQARTALAAIKAESKGALQEVRSVLEVLRRVDETAPRTPAPSLERLDDLVAAMSAAGIEVEVRTQGAVRTLPANIELAGFRIVQEALTNVARHAGTDRATVLIDYDSDALTIQIDDDGSGTGPPGDGAGNGIAGMRERAVALAGQFSAAPRADGGFRVSARLPLEAPK